MYCLESKRLIASHLSAIEDWKRVVRTNFSGEEHPDARHAWKKALAAEQAISEHFKEHACDAPSAFLERLARVVPAAEG